MTERPRANESATFERSRWGWRKRRTDPWNRRGPDWESGRRRVWPV